MMNDDGYAGPFGSEPAQNPRLAAVGMNEIRFVGAKNLFEPAQGQPVFQRMNRPDELGNDFQQFGNGRNFRRQRTFRAEGRTGNQSDLNAGDPAQAEHGSDGIFLRASDDESRDDVTDAHD